MFELAQAIPDVNLLLALQPEELGAKLLFFLKRRKIRRDMFMQTDLNAELWPQSYIPGRQTAYPREKRDAVELALTEAWVWLEAQGLIVPATEPNGRNGWRVLSRRAQAMESEAEFANYRVARLLPKEILHQRIADVVWGAFMRGEFDGAAFHAMKAVEVSARQAAELGDDLMGVKLMRKAFAPNDGPLTDSKMEVGEQEGRMHFFSGAIASYKNPHSHRDVNLDDPLEALEIIYLANHLLRIIDARAKARKEKTA